MRTNRSVRSNRGSSAGVGGMGGGGPSGLSFYIDSATGNDANSGTITSPWASFTNVAAVANNSTLLLKSGTTFTSALTLPARIELTFGIYGGVAPAVINGLTSILGIAANWTEVGDDGVTPSPGSNKWVRTLSGTTGNVILVTNRTTDAGWYGGETGFTSWREDVSATITTVSAAGRWQIPAFGTSPNKIWVYCVGNPATTFTSLELSVPGIGIDASLATRATVRNITVKGWEQGFYESSGCTVSDLLVQFCGGFGTRIGKAGSYSLARVKVYDCGAESITDTNDVSSNAFLLNGDADGANRLMFVTATDCIGDNTRDDVFHIGGSNNGIASGSTLAVLTTKNGYARFMQSGHDENLFDNQVLQVTPTLTGLYFGSPQDARSPTVFKHSAVHNYGGLTSLTDCVINARDTGASAEAWPLYNRRGGQGFTAIRCGMSSYSTIGGPSFLDGGVNTMVECGGFMAGSTLSFFRPSAGDFTALRCSVFGAQKLMTTLRTTMAGVLTTTTFVSVINGDGSATVTGTNTNTTSWVLGNARIEIPTATSATWMIGVWDITSATYANGTNNVFTFNIPASASPVAGTVNKTGMTMFTVPKLKAFGGNLGYTIQGCGTIQRSYHLDATVAAFGSNAAHNPTTDRGWTDNWTTTPPMAFTAEGSAINYTIAQTVAVAAVAGNLIYDSTGKLGGAAWKCSITGGDGVTWKTITGITVSGSIATVACTAHGYSVGNKIFLGGTGIDNLEGFAFVDTVPTADSFTFITERGITNQSAGANATATASQTGTTVTLASIVGNLRVGQIIAGGTFGLGTRILSFGTYTTGAVAGTVAVQISQTVVSTSATASMAATDLTPTSAVAGKGSFPQPDVSAYTTTDLQGRALSANSNFGCVA